MTFVVIGGLILSAVLFSAKLFGDMNRKYAREQRELFAEVDKLERYKEVVKKEIDAKRRNIERLKDDLALYEQAAAAVEEDKQREVFRSKKRPEQSPVDVLLQRNQVKPEQVQKARDYKVSTESPMAVEDILLMFDYATSEQVKSAKSAAQGH